MSADRELERVVRSWIREDGREDADRVLHAVLSDIDTTPQRRATWWPVRRHPTMNKYFGFAVAAAAILVAAVIGYRLLGNDSNTGGPPLATATPQPFSAGSISTTGRYAVALSHAPINAVLSLGPGWESGGWFVKTDDAAIVFFTPERVYGDACDADAALPNPAPQLTMDEFVDALDAQKNSDMTALVDTSIGGIAARQFEIRPSLGAPCDVVRWWSEPCCGDPAFRGAETIAERQDDPDVVWIMDVAGRRVAVVGYWHHSDAATGNEITQIVNSLDFVAR